MYYAYDWDLYDKDITSLHALKAARARLVNESIKDYNLGLAGKNIHSELGKKILNQLEQIRVLRVERANLDYEYGISFINIEYKHMLEIKAYENDAIKAREQYTSELNVYKNEYEDSERGSQRNSFSD